MKYITTIDDHEYLIEVLDEHHVRLNGKTLEVNFESVGGQPVYSLIVDGKSYEAYIYPEENELQVLLMGRLYPAYVEDEGEKRLRSASGSTVSTSTTFLLKAPMPGLVVALPVSEGQRVEKGELLLILESMKMQNELKSPRAGTVMHLHVKAGDSVEQRQKLLSVV